MKLKYHYPDFLRTYNILGINKLLNYYKENMSNVKGYQSCIDIFEIGSSNLFHNVEILYKMDKDNNVNIHFIDKFTENYLYDLDYSVIKIKKMLINSYNNVNKIPSDFNPEIYKKLNIDLINHNETQLKEHFLNHGLKEGRFYKENQVIETPLYLKTNK
jgi:hypothetical protein